jgi:serine protease SohB
MISTWLQKTDLSTFFWILIPILILMFFLMRRKKNKASVLNQHPIGLWKYHERTKVRVKKAYGALLSMEELGSKKEKRKLQKEVRHKLKQKAKEASGPCPPTSNGEKAAAVLEFKGDLKASNRWQLSRLVDEILLNRKSISEVVVLIESPGGSVPEYGHVYKELSRIREASLELTVCVDTVAASGGYLASLPAHQILAAPFAMVGSIGVVSFIPNIRKLLEKWNIKPRTFTAGSYKRTVTLTDDASEEDIKHYEEQLELIHQQFKAALQNYRPNVSLEKVATGEAWLAKSTLDLDLGLIDGLKSSSDHLMELNKDKDLFFFEEEPEKTKKLWQKLKRKIKVLGSYLD